MDDQAPEIVVLDRRTQHAELDDEVHDRLRNRAARRGVSIEEEARQILTRAVPPPDGLGDLFLKIYGPARGADLDLPPREFHEPLSLEP